VNSIGGGWVASPKVGVVLITLDTTRADRLPAYGYQDAAMPALDRIAREGVVFDQASSVAPLTLPAHASLFTGLLPPAHGVRDNASPALADRQTTLAETFRARGFKTAAFVSSVVLASDRGVAQGFDRYGGVAAHESSGEHRPDRGGAERRQRTADEVVNDALGWLEGVTDARFFLWTHFYDAHRPYDPPEPYRSMYGDPYVAEIAFVDSQIGRLFDALERRGLLDHVVVVVAGDHGESLGDHGEDDHGIFVYESVLRVPLMMRVPGLAARRVGAVVRLTDVMPTVLDLAGLPAPPADGVSLRALLTGQKADLQLEAYSESLYPERLGWSALRALREGRYKLIDAPTPELFDLDRDPFEERNLYDARRTVAEAMARRLRVLARARNEAAPADLAVPADLQDRLASLGYVGWTRPGSRSHGGPAPDPKDCVRAYNARRGGDQLTRPPDTPGCR
jgi:choline-sulfatase